MASLLRRLCGPRFDSGRPCAGGRVELKLAWVLPGLLPDRQSARPILEGEERR
jgi:hypothetical protein